jgi:hypothetical protein
MVCCPKTSAVNRSQQSINKYTQKPYFPLWEAIFPLLLLSPFDLIILRLCGAFRLDLTDNMRESSLKCMRDETDLVESLEGEEGVTTIFPLSCAWWASVLSLLLAWEDCIGECVGEAWTIGLTGGGGAGRDKLGQPRCWETAR